MSGNSITHVRRNPPARLICSYPTNKEVDDINSRRFKALDSVLHTYACEDHPGEDSTRNRITLDRASKLLNANTRWPTKVDLRVGAQVMCITVSRVHSKHQESLLKSEYGSEPLSMLISSSTTDEQYESEIVNGSTGECRHVG